MTAAVQQQIDAAKRAAVPQEQRNGAGAASVEPGPVCVAVATGLHDAQFPGRARVVVTCDRARLGQVLAALKELC